MIGKLIKALTRALLVATLVATPALVLPSVSADSTQIVILFALFAGILIFIEYYATYPSIIEFRYAPPFNRLRFLAIFLTVFSLSVIARGWQEPTVLTEFLGSLGILVGDLIDFPYSPVRLMVIMLPDNASVDLTNAVRTASGLSYMISLATPYRLLHCRSRI